MIQIPKSCQNIKPFFKLNNENKIIVDNNENEDDPDDTLGKYISIYFVGYLFIGYFIFLSQHVIILLILQNGKINENVICDTPEAGPDVSYSFITYLCIIKTFFLLLFIYSHYNNITQKRYFGYCQR